jgi:hypothetical protein
MVVFGVRSPKKSLKRDDVIYDSIDQDSAVGRRQAKNPSQPIKIECEEQRTTEAHTFNVKAAVHASFSSLLIVTLPTPFLVIRTKGKVIWRGRRR